MFSIKAKLRFRHCISFLLVLAVSVSLPAVCCADDSAISEPGAVIEAQSIQKMVDGYFAEHGLNPDMISIGYLYTGSNESWYHNADAWYYSASLYKVPLMMLYAEREAAGELTQDSEFFGLPLSYLEDEILTFSNNDLAYSMMLNLADPFACRSLFRAYADLPEDYYSWLFTGYSYFSARFMTEVMYTLFREPDRFPGITERLKKAQPEHYFRMSLEGAGVDIAQKYGNYQDEEGNDWNHTAGIVYTEKPFLLTVMTRYGGISENIIADLAQLFYDYTLSIDTVPVPMNSEQGIPAEQAPPAGMSEGQNSVAEVPVPEEKHALSNEAQDAAPSDSKGENTVSQEALRHEADKRLFFVLICSGCVLVLLLLFISRKRQPRRRRKM